MIPRFKKKLKIGKQRLKKEEFLKEHNKLSPINLKATISLLSLFKTEKASLFNGEIRNNWSMDKHRRPFILWLTSFSSEEKENINKS